MATEIEFCLLGPLMVHCGGAVMPVPQGKQRAVLAALLLNAGRVVSLDDLTEVLWGHSPPPSARVAIQNYVMRLRKGLGHAAGSRISTERPGYLIRLDPSELDVSRFEAHLHAARAAARDSAWDTAAAETRAALSLWRGEPLADIHSELLAAGEIPRLAEQRLQALETRIDADLHLGRHAEVITELSRLTGSHPLRERLHGLLMLALYREGRQGEALAAYRRARQVLVEELGAEPGAGLGELHRQILTGNPKLASAEPASPAAGSAPPMLPRELPARVPHFTGRAKELDTLTGLLKKPGEETSGTVVISVIGGTAGVGKSALAVHWAHQVADRFPDGQLYVNLRGYDPGQPMPATDALARFLRALGVSGQDIPAEEDERAVRYRSLLAGKRILVILDNAGSAKQARPLLPGTPACTVVMTSRDSLSGLVARDGATRLDLDLLPLPDAVGLLDGLIGVRVSADPAAAEALAVRCCRLPLALRVAAELAAARPAAALAELAGELADQQRRLELLDVGGDPLTAVRAVFSWSYRHLETDPARTFRLLGLHPGPDFDRYAVAALTSTTVEQGRRVLDVLARAHLIQPATPGRYGMHDLLRAYACELATGHDGEDERRAALTRLFDHCLHTAATAMDTLYPAEHRYRPRVFPPATPVPPVNDPAAARGWLDAERATLVAVAEHTASRGWPGHATRLAATLFRYLDTGGHYPEAVIIHTCARHAARQTSDRRAEADVLNSLGLVDWRQGRYQQATGHLRQALALFRETGDRNGEARALGNLGLLDWRQGRYRQATAHYRQALALFRETGDRNGEARTLGNLGFADERQGRYHQASEHHQQALALHREIGDRAGEARALGNLGAVDLRQGRYRQAAGHQHQALVLFREIGDSIGAAHVLADLGVIGVRQGCWQEATGHLQQALALFREIGDWSGEAEALNGLGEAFLATGQPGHARSQHTAALDLASQIGDQYEQARARNGLAHSYQAAGDLGQARRQWQEACTLYAGLGAPEADQVRARLTTMGKAGHLQP